MRVLLFSSLVLLIGSPAFSQSSREWPVYGGSAESTRYSSLKQINEANVKGLEIAWTYDVTDGAPDCRPARSSIDGLLYANTPGGRIVALMRRPGS